MHAAAILSVVCDWPVGPRVDGHLAPLAGLSHVGRNMAPHMKYSNMTAVLRPVVASCGVDGKRLHVDDQRTGEPVESWEIPSDFIYRCDSF